LAVLMAALLGAANAAALEGAEGEVAAQPPARPLTLRDAVVLGVVEGVTEYLPVSSTGHLILASRALGLDGGRWGNDEGARALAAFEIIIQSGAVLAVLGLYWRRVRQMILGVLGRDREGLRLVGLLLLAFLPSALAGLAAHDAIKARLFSPSPVALALAVGGVMMLAVDALGLGRRAAAGPAGGGFEIRIGQALFIGLFQCLALWPGTSRSMVTIVGGVLADLPLVQAAEFSFLLALPTLGMATAYEAVGSRGELLAYVGPAELTVGLVVSGVVAALSVRGLVRWLTGHGLWPFGVYRIGLAAVVLWLLGR